MRRTFLNIYHLTLKELKTLFFDKVMLFFVFYSFSFSIYIGGTATSSEIHNATIAFVDQDRSSLSARIIDGFYKPRFKTPDIIDFYHIDTTMDEGIYTFVVVIPPEFEKNILAGNAPDIQVNIDATRMSQASLGASYIQNIITQEISTFLGSNSSTINPSLISRYKYNPSLESMWFGSITKVIDNIVMISILLAGAAIIREREHGTLEHLLVMPLNAYEIMSAKILSACLVVLLSVAFSLTVVLQMILQIPIQGSIPLFMFATLTVLFATTSMGIFIGTIVKNMPQMGMIFILVVLPLMMLSGSITPFESMPQTIQYIMQLMPTSHFVNLSQAILFKGAGLSIVWKQIFIIFIIGSVFFTLTLIFFKNSLDSEG